MRPAERERGAALLTVLLLVAIISVLAATALERLRLSTRLAGNAAAIEQGRAFALAAETLALTRIDGLLGQGLDRVTLAGGWSGRPIPLPLPGGGAATARVIDGGNCFNLNGLVVEAGPGVYATNPGARVQFARLMRLLDVPAAVAEQVAAGAGDWIDSDDQVQPQGAEDASYLRGETPYRTAGTLMADPSELRAVSGMTPDLYAKLRPWICTLPVARPSDLNVNTLLPEQAPLVTAQLHEGTPPLAVRDALLRRPPSGWSDPQVFLDQLSANGYTVDEPHLGKVTRWFALRVDVPMGPGVEEHALIDANRLPARLVSRQWGEQS